MHIPRPEFVRGLTIEQRDLPWEEKEC